MLEIHLLKQFKQGLINEFMNAGVTEDESHMVMSHFGDTYLTRVMATLERAYAGRRLKCLLACELLSARMSKHFRGVNQNAEFDFFNVSLELRMKALEISPRAFDTGYVLQQFK